MAEFARLLLSLSLSGGVLTALVAGLILLLRKRVPRAFLYCLWIVVILRFLMPLGTDRSLSGRLFAQPRSAVTDNVWVEKGDMPQIAVGEAAEPDLSPALPAPAPEAPAEIREEAPEVGAKGVSVWTALVSVWAAGAALCVLVRLWSSVRLNSELRRGCGLPDDEELELYRDLTWGDRYPPELICSPAVKSPMLTGLLRPKIWLPMGRSDRDELGFALRHELTHWRRMDLWMKWAAAAVGCVHWFNPASWYLMRAVGRDCEFSCDELITKGLPPEERAAYGELLLESAWEQRRNALFAPFCSQKNMLKERLGIIMGKNLDNKSSRAVFAVALAAAVVMSALLGACGAEARTEDKDLGNILPQEPMSVDGNDRAGNEEGLKALGWETLDNIRIEIDGAVREAVIAKNSSRMTIFVTDDDGESWREDLPEPEYNAGGALMMMDAALWEEEPVRVLADIPDKDVTVYAVSLTYAGPMALVIRRSEELFMFPADFVFNAHLWDSGAAMADYDGDGEDELAVSLVVDSGTGVQMCDLYIFEDTVNGLCISSILEAERAIEAISGEITSEYDPESFRLTLTAGAKTLELDLSDYRDWIEDAPMEHVIAGDYIYYDLDELTAVAMLRPEKMPMFDAALCTVPVIYDGETLSLATTAIDIQPADAG